VARKVIARMHQGLNGSWARDKFQEERTGGRFAKAVFKNPVVRSDAYWGGLRRKGLTYGRGTDQTGGRGLQRKSFSAEEKESITAREARWPH